jgi:uncharacterized membrane protein
MIQVKERAKASSNGLGIGGILFIIFLILKLTNNITWSWWWVTAPIWVPIVLVLVGLLLLGFATYLRRKKV